MMKNTKKGPKKSVANSFRKMFTYQRMEIGTKTHILIVAIAVILGGLGFIAALNRPTHAQYTIAADFKVEEAIEAQQISEGGLAGIDYGWDEFGPTDYIRLDFTVRASTCGGRTEVFRRCSKFFYVLTNDKTDEYYYATVKVWGGGLSSPKDPGNYNEFISGGVGALGMQRLDPSARQEVEQKNLVAQ